MCFFSHPGEPDGRNVRAPGLGHLWPTVPPPHYSGTIVQHHPFATEGPPTSWGFQAAQSTFSHPLASQSPPSPRHGPSPQLPFCWMLMAPSLPALLPVIGVTQLTVPGITSHQGGGGCRGERSPQFTPRSSTVARGTKRHHLLAVFHLQKHHHKVGDHTHDQNQDTWQWRRSDGKYSQDFSHINPGDPSRIREGGGVRSPSQEGSSVCFAFFGLLLSGGLWPGPRVHCMDLYVWEDLYICMWSDTVLGSRLPFPAWLTFCSLDSAGLPQFPFLWADVTPGRFLPLGQDGSCHSTPVSFRPTSFRPGLKATHSSCCPVVDFKLLSYDYTTGN